MIKNLTNETKNIVDFVNDVVFLVDAYANEYDCYRHISIEEFLYSAHARRNDVKANIEWQPGESKIVSFGDEDGDAIGIILDYMLRDGGYSKNDEFVWSFYKMLR